MREWGLPEQKEDPEDEEGDDAGGEDTVEVCPVHGLPLVLNQK